MKSIYQNLFWSNTSSIDNQQSIWNQTKNEKLDSFEYIIDTPTPFYKIGQRLEQPVQRYYFLTNDSILYAESPNGPLKGQMDLERAYVEFDQNDAQLKINNIQVVYSLTFRIDSKSTKLLTNSKDTYIQWKRQLRPRCVLLDFYDHFKVMKMIGKGSFAKVFVAKNKKDDQNYAIKVFAKQSSKVNCEKGQIAKVMRVLFETVDCIHDNGVMHRDLKPDNILIKSKDSSQHHLVIADFGLAELIKKSNHIYKRCGTPGYVAPEILQCTSQEVFYDEKCDIFSLGVILYQIFLDRTPFQGQDYEETIAQNKLAYIDFNDLQRLYNLPQIVVEVLRGTLEKNPAKRKSIQQVLQLPFFNLEQGAELDSEFSIHPNLDKSLNGVVIHVDVPASGKDGMIQKSNNEFNMRSQIWNGNTDTIGGSNILTKSIGHSKEENNIKKPIVRSPSQSMEARPTSNQNIAIFNRENSIHPERSKIYSQNQLDPCDINMSRSRIYQEEQNEQYISRSPSFIEDALYATESGRQQLFLTEKRVPTSIHSQLGNTRQSELDPISKSITKATFSVKDQSNFIQRPILEEPPNSRDSNLHHSNSNNLNNNSINNINGNNVNNNNNIYAKMNNNNLNQNGNINQNHQPTNNNNIKQSNTILINNSIISSYGDIEALSSLKIGSNNEIGEQMKSNGSFNLDFDQVQESPLLSEQMLKLSSMYVIRKFRSVGK